MQFVRQIFLVAGVALVSAGVADWAQAQYGDLTYRIPTDANAIVLLNLEAAEASPLGVKEGWRENHEKQFASGLVLVPPQCNRFVMAARMDFPAFKPRWQVSLCDLRYELSVAKTAARLSGTVDEIADRSVAVVPGDLCLVRFGPRLAGAYTPADRQEVAQWLNGIDANAKRELSPYMSESVKFAENGAPLIMAVDLRQAFSAAEIRPRLEEAESLKGQKVDLDQLAKALASIQGISLGVTITDRRFGKIKVDFAEDISFMAPFAKALLLEVLGNHGSMIDEFETWTAKASGKQITLEGDLLTSGTRRIMSLFDTPPELQKEAAKATQTDPNDAQQKEKQIALASQLYFKQIVSLIDDLRLKRSGTEFVTWNQVGTWFEKYARKIDRMPILNVDPELVKYGAWVAASMRDAENALKGIGPQSRLRQLEVPAYYDVQTYSVPIGVTWSGVYGWGGWTATENLRARGQELSKIRTQEKIRGNASANSTAQGIEQATADMRRYLTQKYQVEF
ncbi:MAG: hypothetical protein SFU86_06020 [Pirellulaceae bacterium]|nr:hypothetical protein [Pirellulaceae bacterium]